MRTPRVLAFTLLALPGIVLAQAPQNLSEETVVCLRTELKGGPWFTDVEVDDLFAGRIPDAETFVQGRLGAERMQAIARTCFPEESGGRTPGSPAPTGEKPMLTPEQRVCVAQFLDSDLLDRLLAGDVRPEDVLSKERVEDIGRACFGGPTTAAYVPPTLDFPPGVAACLKEAVGETAFNEVSSGQRPPTPEEMVKGQSCFPSGPPSDGRPGGVPDLPPATKQCIAGIIGQEKLNQALRLAASGGQPESLITPEEMRQVEETCFGGTSPGAPPGAPHEGGPPPEMIACVERVLGRERVAEFLRGAQPTPDEIRKAEVAGCFPHATPVQPISGGGAPKIPPEVRRCLNDLLGAARVEEFLINRAQPTQEEINRAQTCLGTSSASPVVPESALVPPPSPASDTIQQCLSSCTGSTRTNPDGTTSPYTEAECQTLCGGTVQGAAAERAAPWWITFLLGVIGL